MVIGGWALGHTLSEHRQDLGGTVNTFVSDFRRIAGEFGKIFIIETMGTNVLTYTANGDLMEFYILLEEENGFSREVVRPTTG